MLLFSKRVPLDKDYTLHFGLKEERAEKEEREEEVKDQKVVSE